MVLKPSDSNSLPIVERSMSHPDTVVHLEHDGQVLLVNEQGEGPQLPEQGRMDNSPILRLPTQQEIQSMGIEWEKKTCHDYFLCQYNSIGCEGLSKDRMARTLGIEG